MLPTASPTAFSIEDYKRDLIEGARRGSKPRIQVLEARPTSVTPLEAFQGYDTALDVRLGVEGEPPTWWRRTPFGVLTARGTITNSAGKRIPAVVRCSTPEASPQSREDRAAKRPGEYLARYVVRLQGKQGPLFLRDKLPFFYATTPIPQAQATINAPILASGKTAMAAKVDRTPGAEIKSLQVRKTEFPQEVELRINSLRLGPGRIFGVKTTLHDARGKQWNIKPRFTPNFDNFDDKTFTFDLTSIPLSAGRVVAKGFVQNGDSWPASFQVAVRDAKGNILESSQSEKRGGSTWKIRSSRLVPKPAGPAQPNMPPAPTHTHTLTLVFERLPGGEVATERSWSVGVTESGVKVAGAFLENKGKRQVVRFEQLGIERRPPLMEYWMNLVLPPNLDSKAVLKMNIHADNEPDREVTIPLKPVNAP